MNIQEIGNEVYKIVRNGGYVTSSDACDIADAVREIPIIAAAPDMLDVLKSMVAALGCGLVIQPDCQLQISAEEAIAKAQGEAE